MLCRLQASLFGRVIGGAGFQLINVNNVSLRLGGWQTDTQLLSRKALAATLARHYRDEVIKEAHKVHTAPPPPHPPAPPDSRVCCGARDTVAEIGKGRPNTRSPHVEKHILLSVELRARR